jgi:hypothetical protein
VVLKMGARVMVPRRVLAIAGVIGLLLAIPVPSAAAHDYCVKQGYDWGCVTNDHARWTACDAEKDGNRVYATAYDRTPQGYYDGQTIWDPDGAGGKCAVAVRGHIDRLAVCEYGPGTNWKAICNYGP